MFNLTMIWFLLIPLVLAGGSAIYLKDKGWKLSAISAILVFVIGTLITVAAFLVSSGVQTHDTEIWNGKIINKEREHGEYQRPYSCNCRQVCSGSGQNRSCSTVCDTCYEDRYTVSWSCNTTVGEYEIAKEDWGSRRVYDLPNPKRWLEIEPGQPVAKAMSYTNYVQAVPQALFTPSPAALTEKFKDLIPVYPDRPFDFYKINRFLSPGISVADSGKWNEDISEMLKDRGPSKQVNVVIVAVKTDDPNYEYALRTAWGNANKNDVVVVMGAPEWPKINWVRIITWSKSEIFKVELRDTIQLLNVADREQVIPAIAVQIDKNFVRRSMKEFKYLENEIDPPSWVLMVLVVLQLISAGVIAILMERNFSLNLHRTVRFRR